MGAENSKRCNYSEHEKFSATEELELLHEQLQPAAAKLSSTKGETTDYAASSTQPGDRKLEERVAESTEAHMYTYARQESKVSSSDSGISGLQVTCAAEELDERISEGEDEIDGPESQASKTLRKFLPSLKDAIVLDIESLTLSFYSKYLINDTIRDAVMKQNGQDDAHKAARILQCVERQVKGDETKLRKFIEVLKDSGSGTATDIGEKMHLELEQSTECGAFVNDTSTPLPDHFTPHLGFTSSSQAEASRSNHPPVVTQSSAPASSEHRKRRLDFYKRKYSSLPETESLFEVPPQRLRTSSTCSTGEEDLWEATDNLASQLVTVSQRQKRRELKAFYRLDSTQTELDEATKKIKELTKKEEDAKKIIEELTRKVESLEQRNEQLNLESIEFKGELEKYKKSTTEASINGGLKQNGSSDSNAHLNFECLSLSCQQCKDKDKLIESERKKHKATKENLNTQIQILLRERLAH